MKNLRTWSHLFQVARQEVAVAHLRRGQGRHEEDAEEVTAEWLAVESGHANGRAEAVQEEEREARLATGGGSKFSGQGREDREDLLAPDDWGGLVEAAGRGDDVQAIATAAAEARVAPKVPQRRRGGLHMCRRRGEGNERREADEDADVPSWRLLREYDVGRRFVGLGQAEGREEEAKEEEAAAAAEETEQRNGARQARLQRKDLTQQCLTIISRPSCETSVAFENNLERKKILNGNEYSLRDWKLRAFQELGFGGR